MSKIDVIDKNRIRVSDVIVHIVTIPGEKFSTYFNGDSDIKVNYTDDFTRLDGEYRFKRWYKDHGAGIEFRDYVTSETIFLNKNAISSMKYEHVDKSFDIVKIETTEHKEVKNWLGSVKTVVVKSTEWVELSRLQYFNTQDMSLTALAYLDKYKNS